jgi:hypothetical protein
LVAEIGGFWTIQERIAVPLPTRQQEERRLEPPYPQWEETGPRAAAANLSLGRMTGTSRLPAIYYPSSPATCLTTTLLVLRGQQTLL